MINIQASSANSAWLQALNLLKAQGQDQGSRYGDTTELLHAAFQIDNPRQRVVHARDINPAFAIAEVVWILSGANDVGFPKAWNKKMEDFSDAGIAYFHGAYGYRLGFKPRLSPEVASKLRHDEAFRITKVDQVKAALEALKAKSNSRQVVLNYWHGDFDLPNPEERSKDIPCNIASHLMVRDGKLEWLQVMRSNDMVWGTPYNFIQFMTFQEIFAGWLGVEVGTYNHISDSLHIYHDKHKSRYLDPPIPADDDIPNQADIRLEYPEWERQWNILTGVACGLVEAKDSAKILDLLTMKTHLAQGYQEWVHLLCAEALRKIGDQETALKVIVGAGAYWSKSWLKWYWRPKNQESQGLAH